MALTASQLTELVRKAKIHLRIKDNDPDFLAGAFTLFHDESASATAATASLFSETLTLTITGGANAGTTAIDLSSASYDTLSELVAAVNALATGFVARLVGDSDAASIDLLPFASTSVFGSGNEKTAEVESNALLELIIDETYDAIVAECDRHFFDASYDERVFISDRGSAVLKEPNVSAIHFVGNQTIESMKIEYVGSDQQARAEVTDTELIITSTEGSVDTQTTYTLASASYDTVSELVAGIEENEADWTATLVTDGPSEHLVRQPSRFLKINGNSLSATFDAWEAYSDDYNVQYEAGILQLSSVTLAIARVFYRAGTADLPRPVERELFRLVKAAYDVSKISIAASGEKLGDYQRDSAKWAVADSLDVGKRIKERLSKYVRVMP